MEACAETIEIRPIVGGDMTMQPFFGKYANRRYSKHLPNASLIHTQGLYFGNNPELMTVELKQILRVFSVT